MKLLQHDKQTLRLNKIHHNNCIPVLMLRLCPDPFRFRVGSGLQDWAEQAFVSIPADPSYAHTSPQENLFVNCRGYV